MSNWRATAEQALRMIHNKGRVIKMRRDAQEWAVHAVTLPARGVDDSFVSGTAIHQNRRTLLIAAADCRFPPAPGDIALFDDGNWSVMSVDTVKPGTVALVYKAEIQQ